MMRNQDCQIIELREYQAESFEPNLLSYEFGDSLWRNYKNVIDIDFPSPKTDGNWKSFRADNLITSGSGLRSRDAVEGNVTVHRPDTTSS